MSRELVDKILLHIEGRKIEKVLEQGGRRTWLERRVPTVSIYDAFDEKPGSPDVKKHDPAVPLPLPDSSRDLALSLDHLERLRMDQLYMVASETRRVLRSGGIWVLSGTCSSGSTLRDFLCNAALKLAGKRALELTHYISPEDWKTLEDSKWADGLFTRQLLVLERL
jgi:hypothetical protein